MTKQYNVAICGATGLVGRTMLKVLQERNFPIKSLTLLASARSVGKTISYKGEEIAVKEMTEDSFAGIDIALFSAGGKASKHFAPIAAKSGCIVIDNSSAWRMDSETPLVVPEVNAHALKNHKGIIANPNCSTIQLMVALKPIDEQYGLKRVVCSTYQSITGAGQSGIDKLESELKDDNINKESGRIAFNTMFHAFAENDFTEEENKMINESRKILEIPDLKFAVTCVRLPILGGHAETVVVETQKAFEIKEIKKILANTKGLELKDQPSQAVYASVNDANDNDHVFVSRIRRDESAENSFYMWVVADNVRKGAATNAVQIAEKLIEMELV
jgi:aspartate-semialdehyde dehydrogenase